MFQKLTSTKARHRKYAVSNSNSVTDNRNRTATKVTLFTEATLFSFSNIAEKCTYIMGMCEMCDFGLWTCCAGVNELNTITGVGM